MLNGSIPSVYVKRTGREEGINDRVRVADKKEEGGIKGGDKVW